MALHALAGTPAPSGMLVDLAALENAYYSAKPDPTVPAQHVSFGTSGHRGTSTNSSFNEDHIRAITQAICEYRKIQGYTGILFMGQDTHALSAAAQRTALEVLAANGVETIFQQGGGFTPTPVISHAILKYNAGRTSAFGDGIIITPSHNPPADGGFKYNPPDGGPADTNVTSWIQDRANELLRGGNAGVHYLPYEQAIGKDVIHQADFVPDYVRELSAVVDLDAIKNAGLKIGVDPLGGASVHYWSHVADHFHLNLTVVNPAVDPQFGFMTLDHDGKIRMDCSSPYAMASLVQLKDKFDIAFGNDPDADRHGIVTPSSGLLNPNHYLCVAIRYLIQNRPLWPATARIGKTLVSSGLIDRVCASLRREVYEVPVGFKWFAPGLFDGTVCFGGEESAGASFLRTNGKVWSTDKDGLILGLLACEITARTGRDPGEHYREIEAEFGKSYYTRIDTPSTPEQKARLGKLSPTDVTDSSLAGAPITAKLTAAPGNGASIGGLKVVSENGWFAARPSGTENIYKLYAESFASADHLDTIVAEARDIVQRAL
ncbi:MAG: alpha-D-glucose phosphate-specific phosphoglucomutase [Bryobacterales bacterium]|nr:alpha-D-glucose phosphate-specific phosphoglucomutase [Bryobacterales bacterium]